MLHSPVLQSAVAVGSLDLAYFVILIAVNSYLVC